jgi:flagellar motor switch protein FliM
VQPTTIAVLEMYPLTGNAVMELNPHLVFSIIDRMLGGKGEPLRKARELTDIERTVVERVLLRMLELLEESWSTVVDVRFRFDSMESNPFFVQICPGTDMVLLVTLKVQVGRDGGDDQPLRALHRHGAHGGQAEFPTLVRQYGTEGHSGAFAEILKTRLNAVVGPVALELGHTILSLQDIMQLLEGDVIRLDGTRGDPLGVRVGNRVKFYASPGTVDGAYAAKITEVLSGEAQREEE